MKSIRLMLAGASLLLLCSCGAQVQKETQVANANESKENLNSAVFFLVRKFYMLRCLLGALYFDMRRFGVFWVFSKHKIPRPNQWGSMKNHKK